MRTMASVSFVFFTGTGFGSGSAAYCSPTGGSSVPERVEGTDNRKETTKAKDRKYLGLNVERCFRISKLLENPPINKAGKRKLNDGNQN
jgi:hypothetical protein